MRTGLFVATVVLGIGLLASGCQKKVVTEPATQPDGGGTSSQASSDKGTSADKGAVSQTDKVSSSDVSRYSEAKEGMFSDVYFDYDKYDVKDASRSNLQAVAAYMSKNSGVKLSIEGHCDERGTNEYNLALGDRRAKAVSDFLISLGVPSKRIEVISYGEERPACGEHAEECWQKNRRAHFAILK